MFFNGRKDILEADSFTSLHRLELERVGADQYVHLLLKLDPENYFNEDEQPAFVVLSNGVQTRLLRAEPMPNISSNTAIAQDGSQEISLAQESASPPASAVETAGASSPVECAANADGVGAPAWVSDVTPAEHASETPASSFEEPAATPTPETFAVS